MCTTIVADKLFLGIAHATKRIAHVRIQEEFPMHRLTNPKKFSLDEKLGICLTKRATNILTNFLAVALEQKRFEYVGELVQMYSILDQISEQWHSRKSRFEDVREFDTKLSLDKLLSSGGRVKSNLDVFLNLIQRYSMGGQTCRI